MNRSSSTGFDGVFDGLSHMADGLSGTLDSLFSARPQPQEPPLIRARILKIVSRCRYKPGWTIEAQEHGGFVSILVCCYAPDRDNPELKARISTKLILPDGNYTTEAQVYGEVFRGILAIEQHEAEEMFTYDGERVFDPHKGGA